MKRLKKAAALILSVATLSSSLGTVVIAKDEHRPPIETSSEFSSYEQIANYVAERYIDAGLTKEDIMLMGISNYLDGDDETLVEMLKAMLQSLDPYSDFYTADEYREFENSVNRTFYGIGISMKQNGDFVEIEGFVEENGKAQEAGFMIGDKIAKVNGVDVEGWSLSDVRDRIIGEVNTTVNITVLRDNKYIDIVGTRTEVRQNTVSSVILEGNIGYIAISSFGSNTPEEFRTYLEDYNRKGIEKIILDLRNNPGGLLNSAVNIAQMIVPKGKIVDVKYRNSEYDISYESVIEETDKKYIVLVNESTASSAEILASAIQDSGVGRLMGTQTYGKAVVQQAYPLNNGSVFKLTVGQYITRNGNEINGVGLTPDTTVINTSQRIDATQYTKFDFRTRWAIGDSGTGVKAAKERLKLLGYYDGNTESETFYADLQNAVKAFQIDHGLASYGVIDVPTQVVLEDKFEELEVYDNNQLEEAYKTLGGDVNDLYE